MKTFIVIASLLFTSSAITADEVLIELQDGANRSVFPVKSEETSLGHFDVVGNPDKAGEFSVAFDNSVQMVGKEVVLTEKSRSTDKGIVTENTNRRFIPVSRLPWTGKLSGKSVRIFQGKASKESATSPNKTQQGKPQ